LLQRAYESKHIQKTKLIKIRRMYLFLALSHTRSCSTRRVPFLYQSRERRSVRVAHSLYLYQLLTLSIDCSLSLSIAHSLSLSFVQISTSLVVSHPSSSFFLSRHPSSPGYTKRKKTVHRKLFKKHKIIHPSAHPPCLFFSLFLLSSIFSSLSSLSHPPSCLSLSLFVCNDRKRHRNSSRPRPLFRFFRTG